MEDGLLRAKPSSVTLLFPSRTITVDAAVRDLQAGTLRARVAAAQVLGDVGPADRDRARTALSAALDDDAAEVRAEAASSLGALDADDLGAADPATVAALVRRLDDGAPGVRQAAAIALGTLRAPGGFAPLATALREGAADLRFQAATSLCEIDPIAAFEPLVAALDDRDPLVVGAVALALGATSDPRAAGHLARLIDRGEPGIRFDAAYALAQLGDRRGQDVLAAALTDAERDWDAACALAELGDPAAADALAGVIERRGTTPQVQAKAAATVIALDPAGPHAARARAYLLASLDNRRLPVRGVAVEELARVGGAWAITPLEQLAGRRRGRDLRDEIASAVAAIRARDTSGPA